MAEEFFTEALAWQEKNNYRYEKLIASLFYNFHQFQSVPWNTQETLSSLSMGCSRICSKISRSQGNSNICGILYTNQSLWTACRWPVSLGQCCGDKCRWPRPDQGHRAVRRKIQAYSLQVKHRLQQLKSKPTLKLRVGYDHGPQVPDPRVGQWLEYMEGHERWWDAIWHAAAARGDEEVTMTPEHGPPNYQVSLLFSISLHSLTHLINNASWCH